MKNKFLFLALSLALCSSCNAQKVCHMTINMEYAQGVKGRLLYDDKAEQFYFASLEDDVPFAGYLTNRSSFHLNGYEFVYSDDEGYANYIDEYAKLDYCYVDCMRTKGGCPDDTYDTSSPIPGDYLNAIPVHFYHEKPSADYYNDPSYHPDGIHVVKE